MTSTARRTAAPTVAATTSFWVRARRKTGDGRCTELLGKAPRYRSARGRVSMRPDGLRSPRGGDPPGRGRGGYAAADSRARSERRTEMSFETPGSSMVTP